MWPYSDFQTGLTGDVMEIRGVGPSDVAYFSLYVFVCVTTTYCV